MTDEIIIFDLANTNKEDFTEVINSAKPIICVYFPTYNSSKEDLIWNRKTARALCRIKMCEEYFEKDLTEALFNELLVQDPDLALKLATKNHTLEDEEVCNIEKIVEILKDMHVSIVKEYVHQRKRMMVTKPKINKKIKSGMTIFSTNAVRTYVDKLVSDSKNTNSIYIVRAYRYGDRFDYSYHVGAFTDKDFAIKQAVTEENFRGIKYRCEVVETLIDHVANPFKEEEIVVYPLKRV